MSYIKAVYQLDTLLLVKEFRTFSEPIWVDGLKKEIEEFKQNCITICKDLKVDPKFADMLSSDARYEISWRDEWVFLIIHAPFIKISKAEVEKYLELKGIKVEKAF